MTPQHHIFRATLIACAPWCWFVWLEDDDATQIGLFPCRGRRRAAANEPCFGSAA